MHIKVGSLSRLERRKYNQGVLLAMLFDIADGLNIDLAVLVSFNEQEKMMLWHE